MKQRAAEVFTTVLSGPGEGVKVRPAPTPLDDSTDAEPSPPEYSTFGANPFKRGARNTLESYVPYAVEKPCRCGHFCLKQLKKSEYYIENITSINRLTCSLLKAISTTTMLQKFWELCVLKFIKTDIIQNSNKKMLFAKILKRQLLEQTQTGISHTIALLVMEKIKLKSVDLHGPKLITFR